MVFIRGSLVLIVSIGLLLLIKGLVALHDTLLEFFELVFKQVCEIRRNFFQLFSKLFYLSLLLSLNLIMFSVQLLDVLFEFGLHVLLAPDGDLMLLNCFFQTFFHRTVSSGHLAHHVLGCCFVCVLCGLHLLRFFEDVFLLALTIICAVLLHYQLLLKRLNVSL